MRHPPGTTLLALLALCAACAPDSAVEPGTPDLRTPAAVWAPLPGKFTVTVYPVDGWFADVNRANLAVGMATAAPSRCPGADALHGSGVRAASPRRWP
ncbi:MAG: hypothetical protein IPK12_17820 [Gemmatimonadetes bacterium]|nr:hypothetical protein [Gemmatimonadota bacterium]